MAKSYAFERDAEDDLIIVKSFMGEKGLNLIIDTGASHSVIDFSILIEAGFRLGDSLGIVPISIARGIIWANRFIIPEFSALGYLNKILKLYLISLMTRKRLSKAF